MNPKLTVLGLVCLTCAALENVVENNAFKHVVTALVCGACTVYGGKLTYQAASKIVEGLKSPVKEVAKIGKEKALEELKKIK
jgi:hypothetical protein